MNIHAYATGTIRIKNRHLKGWGDNRLVRFGFWLADRTFTPPLPIYAWVIDHPDGVIVVDTGETHRIQEPDFYPEPLRPVLQSTFKFDVREEDTLGAQLQRAGIDPLAVERVVLTHAHLDHIDGIAAFPNADILIAEPEWAAFSRGATTYVPQVVPRDLRVRPVEYVPEPLGVFTHTYPLTADGKVRLVPTPGHTIGHQSVIVLEDDGKSVFIAGDMSFSVAGLKRHHVDGVALDAAQLRETQRRILDYARDTPTVYLPSHEPDAVRRLAMREVL